MAFVLILMCFLSLRKHDNKRAYDDRIILNLFVRQRMYTQSISKDAGLIYTLLLNEKDMDEFIIENKPYMDTIKESLLESKNSFEKIFEATQCGYLIWNSYKINISGFISEASPQIEEIKTIWSSFEDSITIIYEADEINKEVTEAAIHILEHNTKLLELCEMLQDIILNETIKSSKRAELLFHGFIILLSLITIAVLFHLLRFITLPFNQLYQGLTDRKAHV